MKKPEPEAADTAAVLDDAFVELAYSLPGKKRIIKRSKPPVEVLEPEKARRYAY